MLSLFITLIAFAISANAVAPLISTLSGDIGVQASSFGIFITVQFLSFSAASFLGGFIKERLRLSNYHLVGAGLLVIATAFFAGAAGLRSTLAIVAWVIPLGVAGGAVETFSSIQISALSTEGSSKSLCVSQVFYSVGAFLSPQIVYLILGMGLSWRSAFVIFGALSAIVFGFFVVWNMTRGNFAVAPVDTASQVPAKQSGGSVFPLLLLLMLATVILESLSSSWLSYVFERRFLLTPRDASLALVTFWIGMTAGRLLVIAVPTRFTLWPTIVVSSAALLVTAMCLVATPTPVGSYICVALLGVFLGPLWPVIVMTSRATFRSEKLTSSIIGAGALGSASGPLLGSFLVRQGWTAAFPAVQLVLAALVCSLCFVAWRRSRAGARETPAG